jgi:hypothetical protein
MEGEAENAECEMEFLPREMVGDKKCVIGQLQYPLESV